MHFLIYRDVISVMLIQIWRIVITSPPTPLHRRGEHFSPGGRGVDCFAASSSQWRRNRINFTIV